MMPDRRPAHKPRRLYWRAKGAGSHPNRTDRLARTPPVARMTQPRTHLAIDARLCGEPLEIGDGSARVALTARPEMAVDAAGLVHGGFVFGLADYAAMLAVNEPNVVLGSAEVRFLAPVAVGERLLAAARVVAGGGGRKRRVSVEVRRGETAVLAGDFTCFALDRQVLDPGARRGAPAAELERQGAPASEET
jgi:acyl-coenzyme A thioesterase PaaI-like protein